MTTSWSVYNVTPLTPQGLLLAIEDFQQTYGVAPGRVALHPRNVHLKEHMPPGVELVAFGGCLRNELWLAPTERQGQGQNPAQSSMPSQPAMDVRKLPHPGGRPRRSLPLAEISSLVRGGFSIREVARRLGLPKSTVADRLGLRERRGASSS